MNESSDLQSVVLRSFKHISENDVPEFVLGISFEIVAPTTLVHVYFDGDTPIWKLAWFEQAMQRAFQSEFDEFGENGCGIIIVSRPIFADEHPAPFGYFVFRRPQLDWTSTAPVEPAQFVPPQSLDDPRLEPLLRWNRLSRENAENAIVDSMFKATFSANEATDKFATWLLAGGATVGSFLILNAEKVLPLLGTIGYLSCGLAVCVSCVFGLLSKFMGFQLKLAILTRKQTAESFAAEIEKHREVQQKIQERAEWWGVELDSDIRLSRILQEYFRLMPKITAWLAQKLISKHSGDPQIANRFPAVLFRWQGRNLFFQAFALLVFLIVGVGFAALNYARSTDAGQASQQPTSEEQQAEEGVLLHVGHDPRGT